MFLLKQSGPDIPYVGLRFPKLWVSEAHIDTALLTCKQEFRCHWLQVWLDPGALCFCLFHHLTLLSSVWLHSQAGFLPVVEKIPTGSLRHAGSDSLGSGGGYTLSAST